MGSCRCKPGGPHVQLLVQCPVRFPLETWTSFHQPTLFNESDNVGFLKIVRQEIQNILDSIGPRIRESFAFVWQFLLLRVPTITTVKLTSRTRTRTLHAKLLLNNVQQCETMFGLLIYKPLNHFKDVKVRFIHDSTHSKNQRTCLAKKSVDAMVESIVS